MRIGGFGFSEAAKWGETQEIQRSAQKDRGKGHDGRIYFTDPRDGQEGRAKGRLCRGRQISMGHF